MEWIQCKDSVPEFNINGTQYLVSNTVLIWHPTYDHPLLGFYCPKWPGDGPIPLMGEWCEEESMGFLNNQPTHWMPLPEPPKGKK